MHANAILPGWIETAMTERALHWDKFVERVLPRVPLRRWGVPEDFGAIAVYLTSDASAYHTGDTFVIDGGVRDLLMRLFVLGAAALLLAGCASNERFLWEEYTSAGIQAVGVGQYARAEQLLTRAARKAEELGPQEKGRSLNNLAELYRRQGRAAEAERYFTQALSVKESELGEDHPDVATSLNNLAQLYVAQGRDFEAAPLLERSLAIQEKVLDAEHPILGRTLTLLGEVYRHLGREDALFEVEARRRLLREEDSRPK